MEKRILMNSRFALLLCPFCPAEDDVLYHANRTIIITYQNLSRLYSRTPPTGSVRVWERGRGHRSWTLGIEELNEGDLIFLDGVEKEIGEVWTRLLFLLQTKTILRTAGLDNALYLNPLQAVSSTYGCSRSFRPFVRQMMMRLAAKIASSLFWLVRRVFHSLSLVTCISIVSDLDTWYL
jgi:hypothetical protein